MRPLSSPAPTFLSTTPRGAPRQRGFTILELAVTVAIIGVVAALAWTSLARSNPRARLADAGNQLQTLLHGARQEAIATGQNVIVLFFPQYSSGPDRLGRVIAIVDPSGDFFTDAGKPNFATYEPATPMFHEDAATNQYGRVLTVLDLPRSIVFGPATGLSDKLAPPFDTVPVNKACTFCDAAGVRGAILFDERGRASFRSGNGDTGVQQTLTGYSVSLTQADLGTITTLVITSFTGAALAFNHG